MHFHVNPGPYNEHFDHKGISGRLASQSFDIEHFSFECIHCGPGLILPLIPLEMCWNPWARAVLYFMGLIYSFVGVAIVSDIFMASIEKITSKTKESFVKFEVDGKIEYKLFEDKIWNETVANLTLMALGSSAPEILLSCIEIVGNDFQTGKLGAGTIVGSAAFNLLVITAVCIVAPPKGEIRKIRVWKVFIVTSLFSLFAYFWMVITIDFTTPEVIDVYEAITTLLLFPLLVICAWWADQDFCVRGRKARRASDAENGPEAEIGAFEDEDPMYKDGIVSKDALLALYNHLREINPDLTEEETANLIATKLANDRQKTRVWYRAGITRGLMGGPQLTPVLNDKLTEVYNILSTNLELRTLPSARRESDQNKAIIEWKLASIAVMENVGVLKAILIRHGHLENEVSVRVETFDGTASSGADYVPFNTVVKFDANVTEVEVPVTILDDNQWEPEEEFFIRATVISDAREAVLGKIPIMEVVILDDDKPGTVSFIQRGALVKQNCGNVNLQLKRANGCDGIVKVSYRTVDGTALCPEDYTEKIGQVVFPHGEVSATVSVPIVNSAIEDKNAYFFVTIFDPTDGLQLGDITKVKVTISNDVAFNDAIEKMMMLAAAKADTLDSSRDNYRSQFNDALSVNGGNLDDATTCDYILHVILFPWKVLFACIPPVVYWQGWLCFLVSLFFIGFLTALVGDMAEMFGCLIGMKDTVTAITFVALGTSVPDLFASKSAAAGEKYADNAIGNITGSNSVNVFLGLGLPWTLAAVYHEINGTVAAGDLDFSVLVYSSIALIALFILFLRRMIIKGELGGSAVGKWLTCTGFVILWFIYIILSSLASYSIIPRF